MVTWDDISQSLRLEEVLDEMGVRVNYVNRGEHFASCPLPTHPGADANPSFSVNDDTFLWNCFTCNEGGILPSLAMKVLGIVSWDEALRYLAPFSDADVDGEDDVAFMKQLQGYLERSETPSKRRRGVTLPYYSNSVIEKLESAPVALLDKWGIKDPQTVEDFQIKYDSERRRIKGGKEYVAPAIVIPHYWEDRLVGYQERWIEEDRPKWVPKYTNSDDFPKAQTLYNWGRAVEAARRGEPVIVVESVFTVHRLHELDYTAVATFGASVSDVQVRLLGALGMLVLSYDSDPDYVNAKGVLVKGAGQKALKELTARLSDLAATFVVPNVALEKGDLADLEDDEIHDLIDRCRPSFGA